MFVAVQLQNNDQNISWPVAPKVKLQYLDISY